MREDLPSCCDALYWAGCVRGFLRMHGSLCVRVRVRVRMCVCSSIQLIPSSINFPFPQHVSAFPFPAWSFITKNLCIRINSDYFVIDCKFSDHLKWMLHCVTASLHNMDDPLVCVSDVMSSHTLIPALLRAFQHLWDKWSNNQPLC